MNEWHLEDAFAPVPDVVLDHIDQAITEVNEMERKYRRPTMTLVLAVVLALCVAGGAVAAGIHWSMSDFLTQGIRIGDILPEVRSAIQTDIPQQGGRLEGVTFTAREALCDGKYAWLLFDVTPEEKDTLLLAQGMSSNVPASKLSPELPEEKTIAQWAADSGYARITMIRLEQEQDAQDAFYVERLSWHWQPDGTVSVIVMGPYTRRETGELRLMCQAMPWWSDGAEQQPSQKELITVTVEPGEPMWTAEWSGSEVIPDSDVTIERIELVGTITGMYAEITFIDTHEHHQGVRSGEWLRLVDEQGRELLRGAGTGLSDIRSEQGVETHAVKLPLGENRFLQAVTYAALTEPPETLRISAYRTEGTEMLRFGVVEIPME